MDLSADLWLTLLALGAALVNGAVGYGFSSIITPVAILWYSNKLLNPALVMVEVAVNVALLLRERRRIPATWGRARPVITTLAPGVVLGTLGLAFLAVTDVKVIVYATLLPLVLLQLSGISRPFKNERRGGLAIGPGIGFLYALTTISGPPLALFLRNQGMSKNDFRCAIAQIRVAESSITLTTYAVFSAFFGANLVTLPSIGLLPFLVVPVIIGIPLGTLLLASVSPEFFRRLVMAIDAVLVSYGLTRVLVTVHWLTPTGSYLIFGLAVAGIAGLGTWMLRRVTVRPAPEGEASGPPRGPGGPGSRSGVAPTGPAAPLDRPSHDGAEPAPGS
ncbi:MAG TPA: sulfite exporter TauE/SafE family protein [Thermoplasmata archaeon]|nr:sulfite exporter TauE/SafE family protein [Thermoplasmata archaeon]